MWQEEEVEDKECQSHLEMFQQVVLIKEEAEGDPAAEVQDRPASAFLRCRRPSYARILRELQEGDQQPPPGWCQGREEEAMITGRRTVVRRANAHTISIGKKTDLNNACFSNIW